jgi:hypothetical protein
MEREQWLSVQEADMIQFHPTCEELLHAKATTAPLPNTNIPAHW